MSLAQRLSAFALVALAGCDWPVLVGELRDGATADRGAVTPDVGSDVATADLGADVASDADCAAPRSLCGAACVDLARDPLHCGACARVCAFVNAAPTCSAGTCAFRCAAGFGDCDGNAATGCETDLASSAAHCGACANACPGGASCVAGACAAADAGAPADAGGCASGFGDCDRNSANGCEVDFLNDRNHCGACGAACPAAQSCALGMCR